MFSVGLKAKVSATPACIGFFKTLNATFAFLAFTRLLVMPIAFDPFPIAPKGIKNCTNTLGNS